MLLMPIFSLPPKVVAMGMLSNTDMKPVGNLRWNNDQRQGTPTYLGAQSVPKIGPLGPLFYTPLKVVTMSIWHNTVVKPMETFWENDQWTEFWTYFAPKIGPFSSKFCRLYSFIFTYLEAKNCPPFTCPPFYLQKYLQWAYKSSFQCIECIQDNKRKHMYIYWLISVLLGAKKARNWAHRGRFSHIPESTHSMLVNQVLRKW